MKISLLLTSLLILSSHIFAQGTFERVHTIFQTHCISCHGGPSPDANLNLSGSQEDVYNAIVGAIPTNPHAKAQGYQLIRKGYPRQSFLFRKINHGLDEGITLNVAEGQPMPNLFNPLSEVEIELVRQWILYGVPDTGEVVSEQLLVDYYVNGEGVQKINMPPIPDPGEGVQLHFGPIFLAPGEEVEYSIKRELGFAENYDVVRVDAVMNPESHHLAMYKFYDGHDNVFPDGMRLISGIADAAGIFFNADVVSQWANSYDLNLPDNTAFRWGEQSVLDLSYHILNFTGKILAAEAYVNVYFEPEFSREREMLSAPIYYGGENVGDLIIPNNGQDTTFTWHHYHPDSTFYWEIWSMMAHTHQLGVDYNVWVRNEDGTKGEQIYFGTYDPTHSYDIGFFDWAHPPIREFDTLYKVDMTTGLIHEATFNNSGQDTVGFGLTTEDEMFVTYIHYVKSQYTGVAENVDFGSTRHVNVFPNPFHHKTTFEFDAELLKSGYLTFRLYDLTGRMIEEVNHINELQFVFDRKQLPEGVFIYQISNKKGFKETGKLIISGQ